jgi:tRNA pseudouridine55 synthase
MSLDGALLINKPVGISSFGVIEEIKALLQNRLGVKRRDIPKLGHGGTLDPFATGLLIVLVGRGSKLARYSLGARKVYDGVMLFGQTTIPGDPTAEISERSEALPSSREQIQELATKLTLQPYLQTPPMHSAKKHEGQPLYKLAREGIEIDREPKLCHLYRFDISEYQKPRARFRLECSSGTYVRTLTQDLARFMGTVGMLESLNRSGSGSFSLEKAMTLDALKKSTEPFDQLSCWVPFDQILRDYPRVEATPDESRQLRDGKQTVLFSLLKRAPLSSASDHLLVIMQQERLVGTARKQESGWEIERVFISEEN